MPAAPSGRCSPDDSEGAGLPDQLLLDPRLGAQLRSSSSRSLYVLALEAGLEDAARSSGAASRPGCGTPNRPVAIATRPRRSASPRLTEARREANDILNRAQKLAQETRDADIAATREELERLRVRAADDIEAEKSRAMADLRAEVAEPRARGRRQGRRRIDGRCPPAPPRRGVPARVERARQARGADAQRLVRERP